MENAKILLKELKEVAKDVGVLDKSTKLRCVPQTQRNDPAAAQQPLGRDGLARARRKGSRAAAPTSRARLALRRCCACVVQ